MTPALVKGMIQRPVGADSSATYVKVRPGRLVIKLSVCGPLIEAGLNCQ